MTISLLLPPIFVSSKKKCDGNKLATIALFIIRTREEKKM